MKKVIPFATLLLISAVLLINPTAYGQNSGGQTDQYCPSDFEATVRQGPHTGNATMLGALTLSGRGANLAGLFKSKEGYTVPVQAKVTGNLVTLIFNLGGGLYVEGSGPANKQFDASAKCFRLTGTGGLNGPDPADA